MVCDNNPKSINTASKKPLPVGNIPTNQAISKSPIYIPYTTKEMLLPINIVAINLEGFAVNLDKTVDKKPSCFFSISKCILLADIKAISIPEKNAESNNDTTIIKIEVPKIMI